MPDYISIRHASELDLETLKLERETKREREQH